MKNVAPLNIPLPFFVTIICLLLFSCDSFNSLDFFDLLKKDKPSKNLIIEDEIEIASESVSSSGGTVTVSSPGSEIDGLKIIVPPLSYPESRTFKITTAKITSHNLGEYFNPITPLIQIENGGGYADSVMEITIPVTMPEGHIPIGFYYDEITGKLEGIPVKEVTENSITLLTRHFMSASELSPGEDDLKGIKIDATSNLIIGSISESVLEGKTIISSGFKVGVDNWEFTNYGSYLAPGGHCSGQNFGAMWYYFEKKLKGEDKLYEKFSTITSFDFDNSIGYRFSSVIQKDVAGGYIFEFFRKYIDINHTYDELKYLSIAGSMLVTGEPQDLIIFYQDGNNADGSPYIKYIHNVICYQIAINEGKLYISDPNYPKTPQELIYRNKQFEPYIAKQNGNDDPYPYQFTTWSAKTAFIEWPQIGKRYSELLDSTIGNVAPNTFPAYTLYGIDENDFVLEDGIIYKKDTLRCYPECPTAEAPNVFNGKNIVGVSIFDESGNQISKSENNIISYVVLKPGLNRLGFYIYGWRKGYSKNKIYNDLFIDFQWIDIYYSKLKIAPDPITGSPGNEITITAMPFGMAPSDARYVWDFGDGTKKVTVENDSIVKHIFEKAGNYDVNVSLYNNSTGIIAGYATARANISEGILSILQNMEIVIVEFNVSANYNNAGNAQLLQFTYNNICNKSNEYYPIVWNGSSFSTSIDCTTDLSPSGTKHTTANFSGTMSDDGLTISSILVEGYDYSPGWENMSNFSAINVPYLPDFEYKYDSPRYFGVSGSSVANYITSFKEHDNYDNGVDAPFTMDVTNLNYNDPERKASLRIIFENK